MAEATEAHVDIVDPSGSTRRATLAGSSVIVGRTEDAGLTLPLPTVSRQHAELFTDAFGRWWIKDRGSRNGTIVNGVKIADETLLTPGDKIQIETFLLTFGAKGPLPTRSRTGSAPLSDTLSVSDSPGESISRLDRLPSPKIDAAHLSNLTALAGQLLATENDAARLELLCKLMVSREFHGNAAVAFRINLLSPDEEPQLLCGPISGKNWRGQEKPYISRTLLRGVREQKAPVIASNVASGGEVMALSLAGNVQQLAALACPLHHDDAALDVLYVTFPGEFGTPEWLALAALAAEQFQQAEIAWVARRAAQEQAVLERELQRASKIQNNLIPDQKSLKVPDAELALGFEPCKYVGGDYVDVAMRSDGQACIGIFDVCGKGIQAALITASLHTLFHTNVKLDLTLAEMMERLNDYLETHLPDESFVTAICLLYDPRTGRIESSNAGHPPALIATAAGDVRELPCGENPPLGYIPLPYECNTHELAPGETLCLFTDGLTEAANPAGAMLGVEGVTAILQRIVREQGGAGCPAMAQAMIHQLDAHEADAPRGDDRTFLLMRRQ